MKMMQKEMDMLVEEEEAVRERGEVMKMMQKEMDMLVGGQALKHFNEIATRYRMTKSDAIHLGVFFAIAYRHINGAED